MGAGLSRIAELKRKTRVFIQAPRTEALIVGLIFVSVVLIVWTTAFPPGPRLLRIILRIEDGITILFILELLIRYWVEPRKRTFFRQYWIDILAVLPILRIFRVFRILRLLRLLRILRLFRAGLIVSRRISEASQIFSEGLAHYFLVTMLVVLVVLFGALALVHFEGHSTLAAARPAAVVMGGPGAAGFEVAVPRGEEEGIKFTDALWWATFSIVAGEPIDYSPKTIGGRVVAVVIMFSGLTVFAFITGVVSAFMVERLRMGLQRAEIYPEELDGHFVVLGWNNRAPFIIEELQAEEAHRGRYTVILADRDTPEDPEWQSVDRNLVYFVRGDPISPKELAGLALDRAFSVTILADVCRSRNDVDRDARTVLCALMVEKIYPGAYTCAELINREHASHLKLAGVEEVVITNESSASVLAMAALHLDMTKILNELLSFKVGNQFYKVPVPASWHGKPFVEAVLTAKDKFDALVIGLAPERAEWDAAWREVDEGKEIMINPPSKVRLAEGDKLLCIASNRFTLT